MKNSAKTLTVNKLLVAVILASLFSSCVKEGIVANKQSTNLSKSAASSDSSTSPVTTDSVAYGQTITFAGNGSGNTFYAPNQIAIDATGNLFVTNQAANNILKITPAGVVSIFAGSGQQGTADGQGTNASFNNPIGIAIDKATNNVFVTDFGNNIIRKITPGGAVSTFAGTGAIGYDDGTASSCTFNGPTGIAVDSKGNVFVADNHQLIREINPSGTTSTFAGYVHIMPGFADGQGNAANFRLPEQLAIDGNDNIYVADYSNNMIRKITPGGLVSTVAGALTPGFVNGALSQTTFNGPLGVAVDAAGNLFVNDNINNVVRKISVAGVVTTLAGTGSIGANNGANSTATFNDLHGIAVDAKGNVYVSDEQNNMIREIIVQAPPVVSTSITPVHKGK